MTKELIEYVVKQLVNYPDEVHVSVVKSDQGVLLLEITAHEQDRGKIIGRSGQTIKALRMLVNAITDDRKIAVDIAKQK